MHLWQIYTITVKISPHLHPTFANPFCTENTIASTSKTVQYELSHPLNSNGILYLNRKLSCHLHKTTTTQYPMSNEPWTSSSTLFLFHHKKTLHSYFKHFITFLANLRISLFANCRVECHHYIPITPQDNSLYCRHYANYALAQNSIFISTPTKVQLRVIISPDGKNTEVVFILQPHNFLKGTRLDKMLPTPIFY